MMRRLLLLLGRVRAFVVRDFQLAVSYRLEFFNVFDAGARILLDSRPAFDARAEAQPGRSAHMLVVGLDGIARLSDFGVAYVRRLTGEEEETSRGKPAFTAPEIGGFTTREAQEMVRLLDGLKIVGADVVEVAPPFDLGGMTALAGATMMFELLCVMAKSLAGRVRG